MRFSEETRKRMSEAARKRWEAMGSEVRGLLAQQHSEKMKRVWAEKTPEERREQARKAAQTRKKNRKSVEDKDA